MMNDKNFYLLSEDKNLFPNAINLSKDTLKNKKIRRHFLYEKIYVSLHAENKGITKTQNIRKNYYHF